MRLWFWEEEQRNGRAFEPAEEASDVELATTWLVEATVVGSWKVGGPYTGTVLPYRNL